MVGKLGKVYRKHVASWWTQSLKMNCNNYPWYKRTCWHLEIEIRERIPQTVLHLVWKIRACIPQTCCKLGDRFKNKWKRA